MSSIFSSPNLNVPPNCGRRVITAVLDEVAVNDPNRVFVSIPKSNDMSEGFQDISYAIFSLAVNKCAWYLREKLGENYNPKTILYMGPLDLRYVIIILAAAKAGHLAFFSSHRNSLEAHISLLDRCGSDVVLLPKRAPAITNQILESRPLVQIEMPELDFFLTDLDSVKPMPVTMAWEEAKTKPFCVLHTSGSTGIPKPVFVTYGTLASNDAHQLIPSLGGEPTLINFLQGRRLFLGLPLFHAACLTFVMVFNIFSGVICVLPPPEPLTSEVANQVFLYGKADGAVMAPSLIVDCYNNNIHCVNMVQRLKFLSYVGGILPEEVGNALTSRIKLMTLMGACETALHPLEINEDPADWQYLTLSPFLGHTFRLDRDGLSDLVVVRTPKYELFQGVFNTFPEKSEYAMGDLFQSHQRRPRSWVFRARKDDIIAFTTAEKLNPITMESVISTNTKIKSAVIGGQGQFQASVLIEPHVYPASPTEEAQFIRDIWPSILQANRDCPAHGRIMRGFVMLTSAEKPIPRAGKGTVQRHAALKLYADEFNALYERMRPHIKPRNQEEMASHTLVNKDQLNRQIEETIYRLLPEAVESAVKTVLTRLLSGLDQTRGFVHGRTSTVAQDVDTVNPPDLKKIIYDQLAENMTMDGIEDDSDLFRFGLDSLQVVDLTSTLNAYLIKWMPNKDLIEPKEVYDHPSVIEILNLMA